MQAMRPIWLGKCGTLIGLLLIVGFANACDREAPRADTAPTPIESAPANKQTTVQTSEPDSDTALATAKRNGFLGFLPRGNPPSDIAAGNSTVDDSATLVEESDALEPVTPEEPASNNEALAEVVPPGIFELLGKRAREDTSTSSEPNSGNAEPLVFGMARAPPSTATLFRKQ